MRRLAILAALVLAGCASATAPTPILSGAVPSAPSTSPTALPSFRVNVVPCTVDLPLGPKKDPTCMDSAFHITNPVAQGGRVTLTVKVKNSGRKPSPPLSVTSFSDERTRGLGLWMPDYLKVASCNGCKSRTVNDATTYEFQWPSLAAGATRNLVLTFTAAGSPGHYNWYIYLVTETMDAMDNGMFPGPDPQKVGEWDAQTVIEIK
jgi:hypothetical protein